MATTTQACSARLSADREKIILGPGPPEWTEFCHSLPAARWSQLTCSWSCAFTPAAAWRIASRVELDEHNLIAVAANKFRDCISDAHARLVSDADILEPRSKTTAWQHQKIAFEFARRLQKATMLGLEMGTGKSKVAVDLMTAWECKKILILCPTSVRGVWRREIAKHAAMPITACVLDHGSAAKKTYLAEAAMVNAARTDKPLAIVNNYESARMPVFAEWSLRQEWDLVVLDESHRIKSHNSQISKYAAKLSKRAKRRLCLTGTPLAQSPLDLFGQFRFLEPGLFGTSWHHFSNRYAIKGNPYIPQQITGYKNQDELQRLYKLLTYRCTAADVLDLPEAMYEERTFELAPKAKKHTGSSRRNLLPTWTVAWSPSATPWCGCCGCNR